MHEPFIVEVLRCRYLVLRGCLRGTQGMHPGPAVPVLFNRYVQQPPASQPSSERPRQQDLVVDLRVMSRPLRIELDHADAALTEKIRTAWTRCIPAGSADAAPSPVTTLRFANPGNGSADSLMSDISTRVTLEAIAQWSGKKLLFHAAGLSDPASGLTSVLVASSGTGKTTASRVLGQALEYLSDETVCVDLTDLSITAYPKPLSVITRADRPKEQVSPEELGLLPQSRPARMNHVFILQRDPEGPAGELSDPLPLNNALELLAPNISALAAIPAPLSTLIGIFRKVGGVRAVRYTNIENVAETLTRVTAIPAVPLDNPIPLRAWLNPTPPKISTDPEKVVAPLPEPGPGPSAVSGPKTDPENPDSLEAAPVTEPSGVVVDHRCVRASPWVEAVENPEDPGQLIVLLAEQLVVLAGIAPVVWHACREHGERSPRQLEMAVVEAFGHNPRARELVNQCVAELVRTGALQPV